MNLDKAIEIVSMSANAGSTTFDQDFKDAQKLLIEAGKRENGIRAGLPPTLVRLLPGETND